MAEDVEVSVWIVCVYDVLHDFFDDLRSQLDVDDVAVFEPLNDDVAVVLVEPHSD